MIIRTKALDLSGMEEVEYYPESVVEVAMYRQVPIYLDIDRIDVYKRAFNDSDQWSEIIMSGVSFYIPINEQTITRLKQYIIYEHTMN